MAKNNYDPAHEGELAAQRDNYRMKKEAAREKRELTRIRKIEADRRKLDEKN